MDAAISFPSDEWGGSGNMGRDHRQLCRHEYRRPEAIVITLIAMLCGAFTSAAWVAPKPWCYLLGAVACLLFIYVRSHQ
jgi:Mn2+/Fe2+ NRAMP family transporter